MLFQTGGTVLSIMEMLENTETVGVNLYVLKTNHKAIASFLTPFCGPRTVFMYPEYLHTQHFQN